MADLLYESQYFTDTLSVSGGIDASQTTGIVMQSGTGISEPTKPGLGLLSYSDPLDTSDAEWFTYTSFNTTTKEFAGVTRGEEGSSAKAHLNGVTVAFPHSKSHINRINDKLTGVDGGVTLSAPVLSGSATGTYTLAGTPTITSPTITAATIGISEMNQGWDGWIAATDTWTYASATTFTIAGVDRTALFPKGTKIKLTQTTAKYFYVTGSAFSTNTTITVTGGSDYTLANAAITSPYYSYTSSPQGFPDWFNYTPTLVGFSSDPSSSTYRFSIKGTTVFLSVSQTGDGTSNATNFTISLPATAAAVSNLGWWGACGLSKDAGTIMTTPAGWRIDASATVVTLYKDMSTGAWTNSGAKRTRFIAFYEI